MMPNREKVIKALQSCSVQNDVGCQGCPYLEERKTYGYEWCTTSMAQDALAMLKEQEAVKPEREHSGSGVTWWNVCGNCKTAINPNDKFCSECGRPVLWEGR